MMANTWYTLCTNSNGKKTIPRSHNHMIVGVKLIVGEGEQKKESVEVDIYDRQYEPSSSDFVYAQESVAMTANKLIEIKRSEKRVEIIFDTGAVTVTSPHPIVLNKKASDPHRGFVGCGFAIGATDRIHSDNEIKKEAAKNPGQKYYTHSVLKMDSQSHPQVFKLLELHGRDAAIHEIVMFAEASFSVTI